MDDDQKLNGEAEEEEKIEFEKGDINLDVSRYFSIKLFRIFGMCTWYVKYLLLSLKSALICL